MALLVVAFDHFLGKIYSLTWPYLMLPSLALHKGSYWRKAF